MSTAEDAIRRGVVSIGTIRGSSFIRTAAALALSSGGPGAAAAYAATRFANTPSVAAFLKEATTAIGTGGDGFPVAPEAREFLEVVRPLTIIGRFGRDGVPSLRRIPFISTLAAMLGSGTYAWVTGGKSIPVSRPTYAPANLPPMVAGGIVPVTEEALTFTTPAGEEALRDWLAAGLATFINDAFINPTNTGTPDVAPASITSAGTEVPSTSTTDPGEDLRALLAGFTSLDGVVLIASEQTAIAWATMLPSGSFTTGRLFNVLPVILSSAADDNIVAVRASGVALADDGAVGIAASRHATLEMATDPTHNSSTPTEMVSMFQANLYAVRLLRTIAWSVPRGGTDVRYVSGAQYGTPAT